MATGSLWIGRARGYITGASAFLLVATVFLWTRFVGKPRADDQAIKGVKKAHRMELPVAHNTRSRQRKRKGTALLPGLATPRKPKAAGAEGAGGAEAEAAGAASQEPLVDKENVQSQAAEEVAMDNDGSSASHSHSSSKKALAASNLREEGGEAKSKDKSMRSISSAALSAKADADADADGDANTEAEAKQQTEGATSGDGVEDAAAVAAREAAVTVISSAELVALGSPADVETQCARVVSSLSTDDWVEQHEATTMMRRLVKHHRAEVDAALLGPQLRPALEFLRGGVQSLRSAQTRNALLAVQELFQDMGHSKAELLAGKSSSTSMLQEVADAVILKSVNEKRFIANAGEGAMQHMVASAPCLPVLHALLAHSASKNPKVCAVVAKHAAACLRGLLKRNPACVTGAASASAATPASATSSSSSSSSADAADTGVAARASRAQSSKTVVALVKGFSQLERSRSVDAKKAALGSLRVLAKTMGPERFAETVHEALSPAEAAEALAAVAKASAKDGAKKPQLKALMAAKRRAMMSNQDTNKSATGIL